MRALCMVLLSCAAAHTAAAAQARPGWQPDERVLISDFSRIVGVTADAWHVHAATATGLVSYDPVRRHWELPLTIEDGYPVRELPSALGRDPVDQQLVLGTRLGTLWRIDPVARRIEPILSVGEPVLRIAHDQHTVYVRTARAWFALEGGFLRPVARGPAELQLDPRLQSLRGTLGTDAFGRRHALTDITPGTRPDEFFVGTDGGGLLHVDARTLRVEPLRYGVSTEAVTSIARIGAQLWFGGDGGRGGPNVMRADTALQRWEWPATPAAAQPRGAVTAIAGHAGAVWLAATDGLFGYDVASDQWRRYDTAEGLPSARVTTLLYHDAALWVGTTGGACLWQGTQCGPALLPGMGVTALAACQGALWVGTEQGLWRIGDAPARVAQLPATRVGALACRGDTIHAAVGEALFAGTGQWQQVAAPGGGPIRALTVAAGALWLLRETGVARWDAEMSAWAYYIAPSDVPPAPVWGILPDGAHLWLATSGGALRLDLQGR